MRWWNSISFEEKWIATVRCKTVIVGYPDRDPRSLTGREIEMIWNRIFNGECTRCRQTVQNCECHIPIEEKHSGLFQMKELIQKLNILK